MLKTVSNGPLVTDSFLHQTKWQRDGNRIPLYYVNICIVQSCDIQYTRIRTRQAQGMKEYLTLIINRSSSKDTLKLNLVAD